MFQIGDWRVLIAYLGVLSDLLCKAPSFAKEGNQTCSIIHSMRAITLAFLIVGFGVGFASMFLFIKPRAAAIARPLPVLPPNPSSAAAARPPLDKDQLKRLQDTVKSDPKNFEALVELGNIQFDEADYDAAAGWYRKALEVH